MIAPKPTRPLWQPLALQHSTPEAGMTWHNKLRRPRSRRPSTSTLLRPVSAQEDELAGPVVTIDEAEERYDSSTSLRLPLSLAAPIWPARSGKEGSW